MKRDKKRQDERTVMRRPAAAAPAMHKRPASADGCWYVKEHRRPNGVVWKMWISPAGKSYRTKGEAIANGYEEDDA